MTKEKAEQMIKRSPYRWPERRQNRRSREDHTNGQREGRIGDQEKVIQMARKKAEQLGPYR